MRVRVPLPAPRIRPGERVPDQSLGTDRARVAAAPLSESVRGPPRRFPVATLPPLDGAGFDTLRVTQVLRDAGIGEAQAEAITESIGVALTGGVATKADLAALEARLHRYLWIVWIVTAIVVSSAVALFELLP